MIEVFDPIKLLGPDLGCDYTWTCNTCNLDLGYDYTWTCNTCYALVSIKPLLPDSGYDLTWTCNTYIVSFKPLGPESRCGRELLSH